MVAVADLAAAAAAVAAVAAVAAAAAAVVAGERTALHHFCFHCCSKSQQ